VSHYVYRIPCPPGTRGITQFLGTRKATYVLRHEARSTLTPHLLEARVFNTSAAANKAGRRVNPAGKAEKVTLTPSWR
jgi:hypothetical protein